MTQLNKIPGFRFYRVTDGGHELLTVTNSEERALAIFKHLYPVHVDNFTVTMWPIDHFDLPLTPKPKTLNGEYDVQSQDL